MASIRRNDVPMYLRAGSFFQSLDPNDDDVFDVPENCFKMGTQIKSEEDFGQLLCSLLFWGVDAVPIEVFAYVVNLENNDFVSDLCTQFPPFESHLSKILQVRKAPAEKRIEAAVKSQLGVTVVQYLFQQGYGLCPHACEAVASIGDVDVLMFLHSNGCLLDEKTVTQAVVHGHVECLKYALEHGCPLPARITQRAAATGNINILKCFHDNGVPWGPGTMGKAVCTKNVDCLRYLHSSGCEIDMMACGNAAFHDSVECLAFLHENGGSFDLVWFNASCGRSLSCMVYFHEHGGQWAPSICSSAADSGRLDCLQYARDHGCPWDENTLKYSVNSCHWRCAWYALANGCPRTDAVNILIDSISCVLTLYTTYLRPADTLLLNFVVLFLPLQRFIKTAREGGYIVVRGAWWWYWKWLFQCMDWLAVPARLYYAFVNLRHILGWFKK